jgi:hypothetical protein
VLEGRGAVLVQWLEGNSLRRGWIPTTAVNDDFEVKDSVLKKAAPYGLPFEKFLPKFTITPTDLADSLHRYGVWTFDDVQKNPNQIAKALLACMGWHASQLQTSVREFNAKKEEAQSG